MQNGTVSRCIKYWVIVEAIKITVAKSESEALNFNISLNTINRFFLLLVCLVFSYSTCLGQLGKPPIIFDNIHSRFDNSRVTDQQKVYLHLDRPYYVSGETIWFKAYVVKAARNQYDYRSGVLIVEVIEPEGAVIISNRLKLSGGITSGSISLPDTLKTAQYVLRAYTNWMRNFAPSFYWTKPIKITEISELENTVTPGIEPATDTTLFAFYPEGGYLLSGIPCQLGFKASNIIGQAVDVSGKILNSNGVKVASFSSTHQGMGSFFFTPYEGNDYFAVLNNISYPLPKALSNGLVMFAYSENLSTIRVSIQGSKSFDGQYFHLLGQNNGVIQYSATGKLRDNKALAIINTEGLPPGILQLTLFDQLGRPQAERLLFVQPKERPGVGIVVNRVGCEPRQKIDVEIELLDNKNKGIESELSIAITDPSQVQIPIYGNNIYSHFYLTSDLEGNVPTPGFYLKDQTKQTQRALDVLLLTHGWRRFRWKDILESSGALQYGFQAGITISGRALNKSSNKPIVEGVVSLIALDHNNSIHQGFTDAEGRFKFSGLDIVKDSWGIIKVKNVKGKSYPTKVLLDSQTDSTVNTLNYHYQIDNSPSQSFLKHAATRRQIDLAFDTTGVEYLDSVVIRAERPNYLAVRRLHSFADVVIKNDRPTYGTIFDLLRGKVAGLQLINRNGITHISIRNLPTPLVLLNGVPLNMVSLGSKGSGQLLSTVSSGSAESEDLYYALLSVDPTDVERIEILKTQATASIYGLQGTNGVIAIYTKGESDVISKMPDFNRVKLPGYFLEREFYAPNYQGTLKNNPKPDRRVTISWQSSVQTDNTGKVKFSFFNSDVACNLDFVVEGLSKDGQPIYFYKQQ